jgi:hypothetical protein
MCVWHITEARSCNNCCSGKAISITYSQYVFVALVIQHAMHRRRIVACGLPSSILFYTLSHKKAPFSKMKIIEHKIWGLIFSTTVVWNIFHCKKNWAMWSYTYICLHLKYALFFSYFNENWISSTDFRQIFKYQMPWKSMQWEPSCSMRTERSTKKKKN